MTAAHDIDRRCIDTIRTLAMDAVQQANSGHPGTPMALAPLGYRLFTTHMTHDPAAPDWADRDRFVLSCGHASTLIYGLLHLTGYDLPLDDIKRFRQLHSPTAGHPERGEVAGVEYTTGPLGQGLSAAVGMALAERMLADRFNREDATVVDHHTYVIASDGDIMEGVQAEAASIAGHLQLGRLIVFWDDNRITIDGTTDVSMTEDVAARYAAYGWQVLQVEDGNDIAEIDAAVAAAKSDPRPTFVVTRTHIGWGSPLQDSPKAHGAPLGPDNIRATKEAYGWPADEQFLVPDDVRDHMGAVRARGAEAHAAWRGRLDALRSADADAAGAFERQMSGDLPDGWDVDLRSLDFTGTELATRQASGKAINAIAPLMPELVGGSADLAESNLTDIAGGGSVAAGTYAGRNLHFGIREHAMAAIANGIVAHGGLRPFVGTFLIFSDYMRPSIRLAALMGLPATYVFTHDSIYLGEDGPTHQPIEQLASLRAMPNLVVLRPAEANETAAAWRVALAQRSRPVAIALTRQKLMSFKRDAGGDVFANVARGGYVLSAGSAPDSPDVVLIGTGSEVHTCLMAAELLELNGISARVVSMPSVELFAEQDESYRSTVLPADSVRIAVEAGTTFGWERYTGDAGAVIGIDRFGLSAPGDQAAAALGITVDNVMDTARARLRAARGEEALHG